MPKHIVSFSGGKDSTALLLMLLERNVPVDEIRFVDTGWEFPDMYAHIEQVEAYIKRPILRLKTDMPLNYWMLERPVIGRKGERKGVVTRIGYGWPSPMRRWCTRLKVQVLYKGAPKDSVWYVGMAADEEHRTKKFSSEKHKGVRVYPLIEWGITEADALAYCYSKGFTWNGLYRHFRRVSCYCCPLQRIDELRTLRIEYPVLWEEMLQRDKAIPNNIGFRGYNTVHDLEARFKKEEESDDFGKAPLQYPATRGA